MIIECSRCHTRAKLPDSKEGAKVRCPECEHVYVAQAGGARGGAARRKEDPTKYVIIGGAIVLFAALAIIGSRGGDNKTQEVVAEEPERDTGPIIPTTGFYSPIVQAVCKLHNYAAATNTSALLRSLDFSAIYGWEQQSPMTGPGVIGPSFLTKSRTDQSAYQTDVINGLSKGRWKDLVADWIPYDGDITAETTERATVRVRCHHRDPNLALPDRWVEWKLAKEKTAERWQATSWERWVSPEEEKAERKARQKTTVKTTLSDGSEVIEGVVSKEFVAWHADTPQALRDEVVQLINVMVNESSARSDVTAARERIENEIGKHAVPGLLFKIAEISPDMGPAGSDIPEGFQLTYEQAVQIQLCHLSLTMITDWNTSYDVHAAMGTTAERQGSGIRQWFGWYQKKFKSFWRNAGSVEEDPFWDDPDFKPRNEREAREFEKYRREREAQGDG